MSAHPISKDTNDIIDRMTSTALSGDLNTAIAVLNQSGLKEDQKAKIASILKEPRSDMRQRIVEVFGAGNIASASSPATHTAPSEQGYDSFAEAPTSPFGNAFPCTFGFEGKLYQNATACFLAQQYTDQPEIMNLFTTLDHEEATSLAEFTPMTKERKNSWENPRAGHINRDGVLMKVLRAKFDQNPDLKNQLLETGDVYLVCQGHGLHLSDNFNGTGKNALGASLMRLRGKFGGTGQVEPPAAYHSATQSLQARSHSIANELYSDVIGNLFYHLFQSDLTTLSAVSCVNKHWNTCSTNLWSGVDLKQLCPELTILDAEAQGVKCEDEPKISKPLLLKWVREICPHVEGNAGVTQLTMTKGTTLNQLIEIAKGEGMDVEVLWDRIIPELGHVPVEQTYGILITNSVFMNSRAKTFDLQKPLVEGHGCVMPTVQEYVALCVYTNKVFKKCLYGQNPWAYGRTSTHVENSPLVVGGSVPAHLSIRSSRYDVFGREDYGAGGQRKV
jgi:predicted NAD-dependent protein-ADP-ribosyltransferase YbiA (DUF1768 family)